MLSRENTIFYPEAAKCISKRRGSCVLVPLFDETKNRAWPEADFE